MNSVAGPSWAVELIDLEKSYRAGWRGDPVYAVRALTWRLAAGQVLGLLGPNGSGKSTTLKLLAGLIAPSAGVARLNGFPVGSDPARALVGYLPESPRFPGHLSGPEFLGYCAGLSALAPKEARARTEETLSWSGLDRAGEKRIETYSKGMLQRLGLAQAVLHDPEIVLLDEPASGLDPEGRVALNSLIRDLAARGKAVIFSSHLLTQAGALCDRIAILGRGRLLVESSANELLGEAGRSASAEMSSLEKLYLQKLSAHESA